MGKTNLQRKLTRKMKIARAQEEAQRVSQFKTKPWWPVEAHTEADALKAIVDLHTRLALIMVDIGEMVACHMDTTQEERQARSLRDRIAAVPEPYRARGAVEYERHLAARLERERRIEDGDDFDDGWLDTDDLYQEPPLYPVGKLEVMTQEELDAEVERQCDIQGRLGDAERIDDQAVERAERRYQLVRDEIARRASDCKVCGGSNGGHTLSCPALGVVKHNVIDGSVV